MIIALAKFIVVHCLQRAKGNNSFSVCTDVRLGDRAPLMTRSDLLCDLKVVVISDRKRLVHSLLFLYKKLLLQEKLGLIFFVLLCNAAVI